MLIEEIKITPTLTENDKKTLLKAINEALAINKAVENEALKIYNIFLGKLNDVDWVKGGDTFSYKEIVFDENVFSQPFNVVFKFNCVNVYKPEFYDDVKRRFSFGNGGMVGAKKFVATVGFLSGSMKDSILPVIQHELEHLYQMTRKKSVKLLINGLGQKSSKIYNTALKTLKNPEATEEQYNVAFLIYTHADFEEDAFVNQMFQELKIGNGIGAEEIKKTNAFKYYKIGIRNLSIISKNREVYEPIINSFGMKCGDFIFVFKKMNRRFIEKIGKVLVKYNDELMENSMIEFFNLYDDGKHFIQ